MRDDGRVSEFSMPGGSRSGVVRVGGSVRRPRTPRSGFVRALLTFFEDAGWEAAPRHLGTDDRGRDVLEFVPGHVAWDPVQPTGVASAGSALAARAEVVCHNDLAPRNTVYRDTGGGLRPVAFIDWDSAAPGRRIEDVAHMCWQYLRLGPEISDAGDAARRIGVICDAYGLQNREEVVDTILWWQDRCARGIESGAAAADPALVRLRDGGAAREVRSAHTWVRAHRDRLAPPS
jgi:aminoglycoside phosphotransferase (APT) family kinase protein